MRPRARVVHVIPSLNVGGLERLVCDLIRFTNRDVFEPHVLCLDELGPWAERAVDSSTPVERVAGAGRGRVSGVLRLARRIRQLNPAVVHTHNLRCHIRGGIAAALGNVPVIVNTKHGPHAANGFLERVADRLACSASSNLVAVSRDCASISSAASLRKMSIVLNGADIERFTARRADPARAGSRAVCIARLASAKDPDTLVRAARIVRAADPTFELDLVGDGPLRSSVEQLIMALDLRASVHVCGAIEDVRDRLQQAAVFVMSSISEGTPLAVIEAMAAGLPVVATPVGGVADLVVPGVTGLLVPPRSPEALATAILTLLRNPDARREMGTQGLRRAADLFDVRRTVAAYEQLYRAGLERFGAWRESRRPAPAATEL